MTRENAQSISAPNKTPPSSNFFNTIARKEANETVGVCNDACFRPNESAIIDATAFYRITENFTIRAGVFNITDKKYALWSDVRGLNASSNITDAFTQLGRNASISISASF